MTYTRKLTFYHAPHKRSFGTLVLLEELNAPHELHVLNVRGGDTRKPEYLAVNPMGKVPALKHGDALITEQVAIFTYLANFSPANKLAPPPPPIPCAAPTCAGWPTTPPASSPPRSTSS